MELSENYLVFPRADGTSFEPDTRRLLIDHLRRALRRAGLVVGYEREHALRWHPKQAI